MENRRIVKVLSAGVATFSLVVTVLSSPALAAQDPGITKPDDKKGYQIQLVYVETSSAAGSNYDDPYAQFRPKLIYLRVQCLVLYP